MTDKTTFVVGGQTYQVSPLTWWTLRRQGAWDHILALGQGGDMLDQTERLITVMHQGLVQDGSDVHLDDILRTASLSEFRALDVSMKALLIASGLGGEAAVGEQSPTIPSSDQPSSGTTSSPSSSAAESVLETGSA